MTHAARRLVPAVATLLLLSALAACERVNRAEERARARVRAASDSAERVLERGASSALQKIAGAASEHLADVADTLGVKVETAAHDAGRELAGAIEAADVKTALAASRDLEGARIDVVMSTRAKTLTLRGTVPQESMRAHAVRIARERAPGYAVIDDLTVVSR